MIPEHLLHLYPGKKNYSKTAGLEIEFSSGVLIGKTWYPGDEGDLNITIALDGKILCVQLLSSTITKFVYNFDDTSETTERELTIMLNGHDNGPMLRIHAIRIEGLNMRLTMEDSGQCIMRGQTCVPSEYMGQVGHQSLKFTTPIYPWLLSNQQKPTYYYENI